VSEGSKELMPDFICGRGLDVFRNDLLQELAGCIGKIIWLIHSVAAFFP
jgi:hypothetical protein